MMPQVLILFPDRWAVTPERLAIALGVTIAFAALARLMRGVNRSGMLAGAGACFCLFFGAGSGAFLCLAALFVLTLLSTRLGVRRKQELGVAEKREGRNAAQVLANLGVPAIGALIFAESGNPIWLVAMTAAFAEAASDTVASEVGQAFGGGARLITNFQPVPAGTDGGITFWGTLAGAASASVLAGIAALRDLISPSQIWLAAFTGFVGMLLDSLLGAVLQRRGWLSNEAVNLVGTLISAALAFIAASRWP